MFRNLLEALTRANVGIVPYSGEPCQPDATIRVPSTYRVPQLEFYVRDVLYVRFSLNTDRGTLEYMSYRDQCLRALTQQLVVCVSLSYWCKYAPPVPIHYTDTLAAPAHVGTTEIHLNQGYTPGAIIKIGGYRYGVVAVNGRTATLHRPLMSSYDSAMPVYGGDCYSLGIPPSMAYFIMPPLSVPPHPTGADLRRHTAEGLHILETRKYEMARRATKVTYQGLYGVCIT